MWSFIYKWRCTCRRSLARVLYECTKAVCVFVGLRVECNNMLILLLIMGDIGWLFRLILLFVLLGRLFDNCDGMSIGVGALLSEEGEWGGLPVSVVTACERLWVGATWAEL